MELSCLIFLFATYLGSCAGKETNVTETEDSHTSKGTVKKSNFHDSGVGGEYFAIQSIVIFIREVNFGQHALKNKWYS